MKMIMISCEFRDKGRCQRISANDYKFYKTLIWNNKRKNDEKQKE